MGLRLSKNGYILNEAPAKCNQKWAVELFPDSKLKLAMNLNVWWAH